MQSYLIALSRRTQLRSCLFVALSAGILLSTSCSKPKTTGATQFTLTVAKEGTYDVKTAVSSELGTGNFHLEFKAISGGSAVVKTASIKVPKTGSVDHYKTMVISGIQLTQGKQIARVVVDSASASGSAAARSSLASTASRPSTPTSTRSAPRVPTS